MTNPRRRWWLDALRRAAQPEQGSASDGAGGLEARILEANEAAQRSLSEAIEIAPRIAEASAKHKAILDAAAERASALASHAEGLTQAAARVGDAFERLAVVALNAGLEGARTQEPQGKALLLIADEVKAHAARGGDTARDLVSVVEEIAAETVQLGKDLAAALVATEEASHESRELVTTAAKARGALDEMERQLRRATGLDPEMSRAVASAAEHARGLVAALSTLRRATQARPLLLGALRPVLLPLARLLGELEAERSAPSDPSASSEADEETES